MPSLCFFLSLSIDCLSFSFSSSSRTRTRSRSSASNFLPWRSRYLSSRSSSTLRLSSSCCSFTKANNSLPSMPNSFPKVTNFSMLYKCSYQVALWHIISPKYIPKKKHLRCALVNTFSQSFVSRQTAPWHITQCKQSMFPNTRTVRVPLNVSLWSSFTYPPLYTNRIIQTLNSISWQIITSKKVTFVFHNSQYVNIISIKRFKC